MVLNTKERPKILLKKRGSKDQDPLHNPLAFIENTAPHKVAFPGEGSAPSSLPKPITKINPQRQRQIKGYHRVKKACPVMFTSEQIE